MGYIIPSDYNRLIQDVSLNQIISGNPVLKYQAESTAVTEMKSFLSAKYDVNSEFTDSVVYNPASIYHAADRIYLDASIYDATGTYILNQLVLYAGNVYYCSIAITAPEAFTPANWTLLGNQYDVFFANYPFQVFDLKKYYRIGDVVFWKNRTYTCRIATTGYSQEELIQYDNTNQIPYHNIFPDAYKVGVNYWTDNGEYNIPAGSLLINNPPATFNFFQSREDLIIKADTTTGFNSGPTITGYIDTTLKGWNYGLELIGYGTLTEGVDYSKNVLGGWNLINSTNITEGVVYAHHFYPVVTETQTEPLPSGDSISQIILTYFTKGDNRNQQMVVYCLDIIIYNLYRRIPPAIVPDIRIVAYRSAIEWLKAVSKGNDVVADIIKIQPPSGSRIRFGSKVKQQNSY